MRGQIFFAFSFFIALLATISLFFLRILQAERKEHASTSLEMAVILDFISFRAH